MQALERRASALERVNAHADRVFSPAERAREQELLARLRQVRLPVQMSVLAAIHRLVHALFVLLVKRGHSLSH